MDADENYVYRMLQPFGTVTRVEFDHGPDTLDRQIMNKLFEREKVYLLLSKETAALPMKFCESSIHTSHSLSSPFINNNDSPLIMGVVSNSNTNTNTNTNTNNSVASNATTFKCTWCCKSKQMSDGYFQGRMYVCVCLQCAAARAEEQLSMYEKANKMQNDGGGRLRALLLGFSPRPHNLSKTALCVFASQRQASKCVYVRSRLAYDGAFATHYHHYSKLKKEIALDFRRRPKIRYISSGNITAIRQRKAAQNAAKLAAAANAAANANINEKDLKEQKEGSAGGDLIVNETNNDNILSIKHETNNNNSNQNESVECKEEGQSLMTLKNNGNKNKSKNKNNKNEKNKEELITIAVSKNSKNQKNNNANDKSVVNNKKNTQKQQQQQQQQTQKMGLKQVTKQTESLDDTHNNEEDEESEEPPNFTRLVTAPVYGSDGTAFLQPYQSSKRSMYFFFFFFFCVCVYVSEK